MLEPRHVKIGGDIFRIDEDAEVPFRRVSESVMVPRTDISGVPGGINLQRDIWLWTLTDFAGGEGRLVFESAAPLGPPAFYKTDGGIDTRVRGEFALHPDEKLVTNPTGGGSAPTVITWTNTQLVAASGSPAFSAGAAGVHVRLAPGDGVRSPDRTPGAATVRAICRFVQTRATKSNKKVGVRFRVRNVTDAVDVTTKTRTL